MQWAEDNALEFRKESAEGMVAVTRNAHSCGSELSYDEDLVVAVTNVNRRKPKQKFGPCKNCGLWHAQICPAERIRCFSCGKIGHFTKLCRQRKRLQFSNMQVTGSSVAGSAIGSELSESLVNIKLNNLQILGLWDTGASECFMDSGLVKTLGLIMKYSPGEAVIMADKKRSKIIGVLHADVQFMDQNRVYRDVKFTVLRGLVAKVFLKLVC